MLLQSTDSTPIFYITFEDCDLLILFCAEIYQLLLSIKQLAIEYIVVLNGTLVVKSAEITIVQILS